MKTIAFVDCFLNTPVNHCVNEIVDRENLISSYHMPCVYGLDSLKTKSKPDAYIILGSASHISQKLKWHNDLLKIIIPDLESGIPVLGICFGHQLIADYYGCTIDYIDKNQTTYTELREIKFLMDYGQYKKGTKIELPYEHAQALTSVSKQIEIIASSSSFNAEIVKHISFPFFGVQAHPESSREFLQNELSISNIPQQDIIKKNGNKLISSFLESII